METKEKFTEMLIDRIAKQLDIDINSYDMSEMVKGMAVELEHGSKDEETNLTSDDAVDTFKIMLAHMKEIPDYYTRLEKMENEAKKVGGVDEVGEVEDGENNEDESEEEGKEKELNEAIRFKELCGLIESDEKKQLKNESFSEKLKNGTAKLLSEELNMEEFDVIKFKADEIGKEKDEEDSELYKMEKGSKEESDTLNLEEF